MKESLTNTILPLSDNFIPSFIENQERKPEFSVMGVPKYFSVGMIDIVNSTNVVARISQNKVSRYYEIFLNMTANIVTQFNAKIIKTTGDGLFFYFPDTCYSKRKFGFLSCIECGFSLMNLHATINQQLENENLPKIDYRISFDYGIVTIIKNTDWKIDLVGPTINTCAKINALSPINGMIFGGDLYEQTKNFNEYDFKKFGSYSMDLKHPYPIYTISRKN